MDIELWIAQTPSRVTSFYFPPLHPIFVNFVAALVPTSFFFEVFGVWTKRETLTAAARWTLAVGAVFAALAAITGWLWAVSMPQHEQTSQLMTWHKWLGTIGVILVIAIALVRWLTIGTHRTPGWVYACFATVVFLALLVQGDLGGAMSFGHGIVIEGDAATRAVESGAMSTTTQPQTTR